MGNLSKGIFYALYIIAATFFFAFYLFPSDAAQKYISGNLTAAHPELNLTIDQIKPVFPPGLRLQAIRLYHHKALLLNAEQINIAPGLLSLFGPEIHFIFKGRAYAGRLKGRGKITKNRAVRKVVIGTELSGIQIKEISSIQDFIDGEISGLLDGKVAYDPGKGSGEHLSARLTLSDCKLELLTPIFNLGNFSFQTITSDIALTHNTLQVKQCNLKGNQMDGTFTGAITIKKPLNKSTLDISGTIRPQPLLFSKLNSIFPGYQKKSGQSGIKITFSGTLEKPDFFFN